MKKVVGTGRKKGEKERECHEKERDRKTYVTPSWSKTKETDFGIASERENNKTGMEWIVLGWVLDVYLRTYSLHPLYVYLPTPRYLIPKHLTYLTLPVRASPHLISSHSMVSSTSYSLLALAG